MWLIGYPAHRLRYPDANPSDLVSEEKLSTARILIVDDDEMFRLAHSSLVETFIDVIDIVPAGTLWFVPTNFKGALDVLSQRKSTIGG